MDIKDQEALDKLFQGANWDSMGTVAHVINTWADLTFPDRIPESALVKLVMEEIPELLTARKRQGMFDDTSELGGELADCFILLLDLAAIWNIDITRAIRLKMKLNAVRSWKQDPATGFFNHLENDNASAVEGSSPADESVRHEALDNRRSEARTDCRGAPLQSVGPGIVIVRFSDGWHTSQLVRASGSWRMGTCTRCGRDLDGGFALPDQIHFGSIGTRDTEKAERQGVV